MTTLVISSADLDTICEGLREAEAYCRFGDPGVAAGILRADRRMLATYARPVCRTSDCMEPVASLRDGSLDPSGWCASCGNTADPEPVCSSCGEVVAEDAPMCADCEAGERRLVEGDLRTAQRADV